MNRLKIVTRSSNLAIKQVEEVMMLLPNVTYEILKIQSFGDKHKEISLPTNTQPDIFTYEIDQALLSDRGDIAIHSAKDLPYPLHPGFEVIALTDAVDQSDCLISNNNKKLGELAPQAKIGISSVLQKKQLKTHALQGQLAVVAKKENGLLKELFLPVDCRKKYGKVYIAGFGPGDPELLTIKAQQALQQADIIFYDSLLDDTYLENFKGEKIKVGKRKDMHMKEQDKINELLYKAAINGKHVVRIKGGDPMIFGRGGEEFCYLKQRLIDVDIIPGITSALAAAAIAGIPLTQRDISSSVAFCTGHPESSIHIPDTDTIVFYMSASNLHIILNKLIEAGRPANIPVALIENISLPEQRIITGTLYEILKKTNTFHSPLLVIVGNTVMVNHSIKRSVPRVLVTGISVEKYRHLGDIVHTPLIELNPPCSFEEMDQAIQKINEFTYLIFTSRYAVYYFFNRLCFLHKDSRSLAGIKIASIGKITSVKLAEYGIIPDLEAKDESSPGLIDLFRAKNIIRETILIPRSDKGLPMLPDGLELLGNHVKTVTVYKNELPSNYNKMDLNDFDFVVFTSPSCVFNFKSLYGDEIPAHLKFIAKGDETARTMDQVSLLNNK